MAYSRFGNSRWYTYWYDEYRPGIKFPTRREKRRQMFMIHDFPTYIISYGELQDKGIGKIWDDIRLFYWTDTKEFKAKKPSESEMRELMTYIKDWERDVNEHFKLLNFIKYEWYYPLRIKILRLWKKIINNRTQDTI